MEATISGNDFHLEILIDEENCRNILLKNQVKGTLISKLRRMPSIFDKNTNYSSCKLIEINQECYFLIGDGYKLENYFSNEEKTLIYIPEKVLFDLVKNNSKKISKGYYENLLNFSNPVTTKKIN